MRTRNLVQLLKAIWSDPQGRRWLVLSQFLLVGQVVFDLLIPHMSQFRGDAKPAEP